MALGGPGGAAVEVLRWRGTEGARPTGGIVAGGGTRFLDRRRRIPDLGLVGCGCPPAPS
jgi:hypothetical protein